ncbi:MAG: hypothetical protein KKG47_16760 [Proteobacteria bacterium]|nr:hypothetical protein [Pseudomonadota bacterium]MBU1738648.1 hypothetical protein [Pseudomonadota bacterium]
MFHNLLHPTILFVTIEAARLRMRCLNDGTELAIDPALAINEKGKIIAIGDSHAVKAAGEDPKNTVANGFKHPRTCMVDFEVAEAALSFLFKRLVSPFSLIKPVMIIQPLEKLEGNLTGVEARWLRELGESVGARKVFVWVGKTLSDQEMLSRQFPEEKGSLL